MKPTKRRISWDVSPEDEVAIRLIAERAEAMYLFTEVPPPTVRDLEMDVTAVHANGCPLRLTALLEATDFHFAHDILGIRNCLDRKTGKLRGRFEPRFTLRRSA